MKLNLLLLLFIVGLTGLYTYLSDKKTTTQQGAKNIASVENKAQDFSFTTLQGDKENLSNLISNQKGQVVILHFWASWCTPCLKELPTLIDLAKNSPDNIKILAMAVQDTPAKIKNFLNKIEKDIPDNFVIGLDPDKAISDKKYGTIKLPETYIIDPQMTIFEKITGADENWADESWMNKLKQLSK